MKTDKHLYSIFSLDPSWLFELMGVEPPDGVRLQSVALKAIERTADALLIPEDDSEPITVAEFQFHRDANIYPRTATEMAQVQIENDLRPVRGVIFFRHHDDDPTTGPWTEIIDAVYLPEAFAELEKREPDHPLVAVFKPVLELDDDILDRDAVKYYRQIRGSQLDQAKRATLQDVFVSWLEQRFTERTKKEIETMLLGQLPDLRETTSGKELIEIGREEGREKGLEEGLEEGRVKTLRTMTLRLVTARFEQITVEFTDRINAIEDADQLETIILRIHEVDNPEDLLS